MTDPYRCLRATSIGIGFYNIIYCLAQFGILGWQVKTVKTLQWEYENRQLPPTGSIDGFQARFPGLYAIYTETPERRRINAMFAIVLICLGLSLIHLMTTISMLYGAIKRASSWIVPWFFTCAPIVVMCTAYAVLWWSGDVFNEQLTMSIAEFVMSLAINGVGFIVVLLYFLRITGRLTSDRPAQPRTTFPYDSFDNNGYNSRQYDKSLNRQTQQQFYPHRRTNSAPNFDDSLRRRKKSPCEPSGELPPWHEPMPNKPSYSVQRKVRRRERDRIRDPKAALRQDYKYRVRPTSYDTSSLPRRRLGSGRMGLAEMTNAQFTNYDVPVQYTQVQPALPPRQRVTSGSQMRNVIPPAIPPTIRSNDWQMERTPFQGAMWKGMSLPPPPSTRRSASMVPRKSPQRVSFKARPKVYQRTPDSSLSSNANGAGFRRHEIQTVV